MAAALGARPAGARRERERREVQRPAEELRVAHVRTRPHRLALELVDLLVDALQRRGVARAEIPAARRLGDVGQQRLVDANGRFS